MAADRTGGKQGLRQEQKPHRSHAGWEQRRHRARAGGCTPAEGACTPPPPGPVHTMAATGTVLGPGSPVLRGHTPMRRTEVATS